ncbi:hypothetical protein [[Phormidium] sp. ETS-05]|uniref:hypothetical protein n=1 Tax=[Phormidium] sp. ETS-05 TaxID=222819 RepID=UPI0018EEFEDD|nr:hypothetical protein [[Phormidium] sp. ETS-05]
MSHHKVVLVGWAVPCPPYNLAFAPARRSSSIGRVGSTLPTLQSRYNFAKLRTFFVPKTG